jgi:hypothetical protein
VIDERKEKELIDTHRTRGSHVGEKQRRDGACHVTSLREFLSTLSFLAFSNDEQGSRPPAPHVHGPTNLEEVLRPPRIRA